MIIAPLRDVWAEPGEIFLIRPSAAALDQMQHAPISPGPASFLQGDHLAGFRATHAAGRQHRGWTGTATEVSQDVNLPALVDAMADLVQAQENLRCWFDLTGSQPVCHLGGSERLEFQVEPVATPAEWTPEALHGLLQGVFDRYCRPDSWAPFVLGVVVRPGSSTWFWGCDHAFTDGASQLMVLDDLADLYRVRCGQQPEQEPLTAELAGSFRAHAAAEHDAVAGLSGTESAIEMWCRAVSDHGGSLPRSPILPESFEPAASTVITQPLLDAATCAAVDAEARAAGGSVQAAVHVALAVVGASRAPGQGEVPSDYYAVTVLATRSADTARTFGWLCNFAPVTFQLGPERVSAVELIERASAALKVTRAVNTVPVHGALAEMIRRGITTPEQLGSPQMVSFLDLRRFPGAGGEVYDRAVHYTGEGRTANTSIWVQRDHDGLSATMVVPDRADIIDECHSYMGELAQVLARIAAAPSEPLMAPAAAGASPRA